MSRLPFFAFLALSLLLTGCYPEPEVQTELPPAPVRLAKAEVSDIQEYYETTGRTEALSVNIVPRVRGVIEKVYFNPGDIVDAGEVLYQIEDFDYKNSVDTALAKLNVAKAERDKTKADYNREKSLEGKGAGFTTQADIDRTKALWDEAVATVSEREAQLAYAQKELERTVIKAPVGGKINKTFVDPGNLVDGSAGTPPTLTTLESMDPIRVYFQVTDAVFAKKYALVINALKEKLGDNFKDKDAYDNQEITQILEEKGISKIASFKMGLAGDGEDVYPYEGQIEYNANTVDLNTGTMTIRGLISNPDYMIYPGNICRIQVPINVISNAVLIDQKAICYDLDTIYVWVIDAQGKAQRRDIKLGPTHGQDKQIVTEGLAGGEVYVTDGTQNLHVGNSVTEVPAAAAPQAAAQ